MTQLFMIKPDLFDLPQVILPEGFVFSPYKEGDGKDWEDIIQKAFGYHKDFEETIGSDPVFDPQRMRFIRKKDSGTLVASCTAWSVNSYPNECGYLHYVAALPEYGGLGLGKAVVLDTLHEMKRRGCCYSVLSTDDFRMPAIKTYLKLGYLPIIKDDDHCERWKKVFDQFGDSFKFNN